MTLPHVRLGDLRNVVVLAAAFVLLSSLWSRFSATRETRSLSAGQIKALRDGPARPLIFPGNYRDTVVLFLDYRCPYCAALYPDIVRADARYGVIVRHAIDDRNSLRGQAAVAAECARRQGRFHAFSYALFSRRDSIGLLSWETFGVAAGVSQPDSLAQCIEHRATIGIVEDDSKLTRQLGVSGTPAAIYGGRIHVGPFSILEMLRVLNSSRQ